MKQQYKQPDATIIKLMTEEILTASNEEVFVDGESLFG